MTRFTPIIALTAATLALGACGLVPQDKLDELAEKGDEIREDTKKGIGQAVDKYCTNIPLTARLSLRTSVNQYAEKGQIIIECNRDQDDVDGES